MNDGTHIFGIFAKMLIALMVFFSFFVLVDIRSALREQATALSAIAVDTAKMTARGDIH